MERNKQKIPSIVQNGCKGTYREDVREHSIGENDGVGGQKEKEGPTGMSSLREEGELLSKEHLPSEKAGEVLSNGLEGASVHKVLTIFC